MDSVLDRHVAGLESINLNAFFLLLGIRWWGPFSWQPAFCSLSAHSEKGSNTWLTLVLNCDRLRPKINAVDLPFDLASLSQTESMETKQNRVKALLNL